MTQSLISERKATVWCMCPAARDSKRKLLVSARATCAPYQSLVACNVRVLPELGCLRWSTGENFWSKIL